MSKIFLKILAFPLLSVILLSGCGSDTDSKAEYNPKPSVESIFSRADNTASAEKITDVCTLDSFNKYNIKHEAYSRIASTMNIFDVEKDIGLPVIRYTNDIYYSIHKITDGKSDKPVYGFIMYKESGTLTDGWCTDALRTYDTMKSLKIGDELNDVRLIDPYFCFFENISENIATGYHTLAGGKEFVINYRRNNNYDQYHISSMVYKNDESGFSDILLDIDRRLVEKDI